MIEKKECIPQKPTLSVKEYSYTYPFSDTPALQRVNFDLHEGEVLGVFGDSASGKTTLFSAILGLNYHFYHDGNHQGLICVGGNSVADIDFFHHMNQFGLVTQDFRNQLLVNNVSEAIAFPLENKGISLDEMQDRVEFLLDLLGIGSLKERDVSQLSGGEGQAVVVASMLAKHPDIMIFDDIASDLDPRAQLRIKEIIKILKGQGFTMIIVDASDPQWLLEEADKALILHEGKQDFFGSSEKLSQDSSVFEKAGLSKQSVDFREGRNSPVAVSIDTVHFSYGDHVAVQNVSARITEGSITGIIGHNGSGKTTLLKMIAGIYKSHIGDIQVDGVHPSDIDARSLVSHVAYLPQNMTGIFFKPTLKEELRFTPDAIGIEPSVTLEMLGLHGLEEHNPEYLSAGQRQRLALGCALSSDPNVLLLDEPTKGLNQRERKELTRQLIELQKKGKTIILVSHDWRFIAQTTNNLLVMDHGQLIADGFTKDVMSNKKLFQEIDMPLPW